LLTAIQDGFPFRQEDLPITIRGFWKIRNDLWTDDGLVLFNSRIVIPSSKRVETFGHLIRSILPAHHTTFANKWRELMDLSDRMDDQAARMKTAYDQYARQLRPLRVGDFCPRPRCRFQALGQAGSHCIRRR
jgi:hypothetical protein